MRLVLITLLGNKCVRCGNSNNLVLHHKDKNELNNALGNFEVLCKLCHSKEHNGEHIETLKRTWILKKVGLRNKFNEGELFPQT
jgi:hypothetical protein